MSSRLFKMSVTSHWVNFLWSRIQILWILICPSHVRWRVPSKCFTYATKTFANSTTYSRKPGDYNGTIIFEIDIIPTQFKIHIFCHCPNQNNTSFLLGLQHSQLSFRVNQNKRKNQKICEKVKFDKDLDWLGMSFSWYQSKK